MPDTASAMRSTAEVSADILRLVQPMTPVEIPLDYAGGSVLAESIVADFSLPVFDNSAMDGYAVRASEVASASAAAPVTLRVLADAAAGAVGLPTVTEGTCVRIMTGAPIPTGADTIVKVEDTDGGTDVVRIDAPSPVGKHIRRAGEDVTEGMTVLGPHTLLGARQLAIAAAVGRGVVRVHPQPTVVVIPTGSELIAPGNPMKPGAIYDSNGHLLAAAVNATGARVVRMPAVTDDPYAFKSAIARAAEIADLIVTSGGVSMGAYDTVKAVLSDLGTVQFEKVAMQPGMPQGFGRVANDVPIITLPGNPVSAYVSFEVFVRPTIRALQGRDEIRRPMRTAVATTAFSSPKVKEQFARGILSGDDRLEVELVGAQGSHVLGGLAAANALIVVPVGQDHVEVGDTVAVMDLREH